VSQSKISDRATIGGSFSGLPTDLRRPQRAKVREVEEELRRRMHDPIPSWGQWPREVVTGFFPDHGGVKQLRRATVRSTTALGPSGDERGSDLLAAIVIVAYTPHLTVQFVKTLEKKCK
jgi:hypothetical protein